MSMPDSSQPDQVAQNAEASSKPPRRGGGKRTPLSCLACRHHKLRCDRRVPCGTCIRYRREVQCRENPAPPRHRRVAVAVGEQQGIEEQPPSTDRANGDSHQGVESHEPRSDAADARNARDASVLSRVNSEHPVSERTGQSESHSVASFAILLGLSPDMNGTPLPSLPQILAGEIRASDSSSSWSFLDASHRKHVWRQQLSAALPSRSQCDLLANYYLEHVNWIFQIIHVPSFRRDYALFWDTGMDQADLIWLSLLFTVISVSALYVPLESVEIVGCPRGSIRHLAHFWHLASQRALRAGDYEARPCLTQLQTFSVTQLYWYATNNIETLNSHLGQAVRNAQAIGLDKDTSASTCLQDEMRHRIWWDLVDADTFQTICLDREPLIRLKDPGVPLPLNCDDHDMTGTSINPRPLNEPTFMSMNIYRAQVFRILNRHFCATQGDCLQSLEGVHLLDAEILELASNFPWYFQLDADGRPPQLPDPLCEVLTWQNHILRTCVSTQRIRMYRPFLADRIEDAWENVVKAAEDALVVYRTLRTDKAKTSRQKFFAQAYQIFSVAVTVAALVLVEGSLPIPNVYKQIKDMAMDLKQLEDQGCPVPMATHGRQVLLKMLALFDSRWTNPASPEDAQRLVPDISIILGGEHRTRAYMGRLSSSQGQLNSPTTTATTAPQLGAAGEEEPVAEGTAADNTIEETLFSPESLINPSWGGMMDDIDPVLFLEDIRPLGLLNWDMTGLLVDVQGK